ncbi:MAG: DUF3747 domain-containing protein [Cyanobacteria bacterium P01_G01_bin.38]
MHSFVRRLTTLSALTAATLFTTVKAAPSAQFEQSPIQADRVVAVAEPVNNGQLYNLLILEQISSVRQCWEEQAGTPTTINPLLLSFDFTGICGRSSDSNGYSVRIGGEDTRYRLEVRQRQNDLVLQAVPSPLQRNLPTIEIGRTNGVANGFVKIQLNAGWEMTRRLYNGQALGHIYLTNNQTFDAVIAAAGGSRPTPSPTPTPTVRPSVTPPSLPAPPSSGQPLPTPGNAQGDYIVFVPGSSEILRRRVQAVESGAFRTNLNGQTVIQAGRFQTQSRAEELRQRLAQANLNVQIAQGTGLPTPSSPSPTPNPSPSGDVFYQVVVPGGSEILRARVNSVESGAFRTTANGQPVIQAGRFRERDRAETLQRRLVQAGLTAQIIQGRGAIASNPTPRPAPRGQVLVMIDPGHGGRDPGAVGIGGLQEKELNLWISQRVQQRLTDQGIQARMTRSDDRELDLQPRVDIAERANATIFVSIHANAISLSRPDVNGLETYYYSSGIGLARTIHNRVLGQTDLRDRGVRRARFYVLRNTSMPAVLVETGFVTGREDVARFRNLSERQQIADAIADGVVDYLRQTAQIQ